MNEINHGYHEDRPHHLWRPTQNINAGPPSSKIIGNYKTATAGISEQDPPECGALNAGAGATPTQEAGQGHSREGAR